VLHDEQQVWRVSGHGWFIVDEVVGKHEFITYAVGLNANGSVKQIEVMDYRETYGGEIRNENWRAQFVGKTSQSPLNWIGILRTSELPPRHRRGEASSRVL
jgi:hypothetical protein